MRLFTPLFRPTMTKFPSKKYREESRLVIAEIHRCDTLIYQNYYRFAKHNFLNKWKKKN